MANANRKTSCITAACINIDLAILSQSRSTVTGNKQAKRGTGTARSTNNIGGVQIFIATPSVFSRISPLMDGLIRLRCPRFVDNDVSVSFCRIPVNINGRSDATQTEGKNAGNRQS